MQSVIPWLTARTIAGFPIKGGAHPVVALAAGAVELSWLCGRAEADATFAPAPPTADLPIRCPAAAQRWLLGQLTYATHQAGEGERGEDSCYTALESLELDFKHAASCVCSKCRIRNLAKNIFSVLQEVHLMWMNRPSLDLRWFIWLGLSARWGQFYGFKLDRCPGFHARFVSISWQHCKGGGNYFSDFLSFSCHFFVSFFVEGFIITNMEVTLAHTHSVKELKKSKQKLFHCTEQHLPPIHPSVADLCGISPSKLFQLEAFWHSFTDPEFPNTQD